MSRSTEKLRRDLADVMGEMKGLAETATKAGRDFTPEELDRVESLKAHADGLKWQINQQAADDKVVAAINSLGSSGPRFNDGSGEKAPAAGPGSKWARQVASKMVARADEYGIKALTSGSIDVPAVVEPIVTAPQRPMRVLDLVSRQRLTATTYEYLRQTVRTNNAAPVADGQTKPTSVYTVSSVEERARVIAHLSEPIPERYFTDYAELVQLIDSQMQEDLLLAVEAQILNGNGAGENLTGILNTSGVVQVEAAADMLTTIRKARTRLETLNEQPTAWVFNPVDLEAVDLLREAGTTGGYLVNDSSLSNVFGSYPRVPSTLVPAGTAILADWSKARLRIREDMRLDVDRSGENFEKNLVRLRVEGRYGFDITRPTSFAIVDLAA